MEVFDPELVGAQLAATGLASGGGAEVGVETKLSDGVGDTDVWASMACRTERSWA